MTDTMTAWTTHGDGIAALHRSSIAVPSPGPSELLVRVAALSLSYRDLLVINGVDGWRPESDIVPISDAVGVVTAIGDTVTRFRTGDRVCPIFLPKWRTGALTPDTYVLPTGGPVNRGMLADYVVIDEDEAAAAPHTLDDAGAATLPIAAVTAWHAVRRRCGVAAGDTVLIHGTGGVSLFALQFAVALGARVIITSSSDDKLARAAAAGSLHAVNYRTAPDVGAEVLRLTDGAGVDHVIETVGGTNLNASLRAVKIGGSIAFTGLIGGVTAEINTYEFVTKNVSVHGIETGSREMFEEMVQFIDEHHIVPIVNSVFALDDISTALEQLAGGGHFGKIVLTRRQARRARERH